METQQGVRRNEYDASVKELESNRSGYWAISYPDLRMMAEKLPAKT